VKLSETIFCRVNATLKRKLVAETRRRRARGVRAREADVTREALIEYFELRESPRPPLAVAQGD
jgi:hypothetical protein